MLRALVITLAATVSATYVYAQEVREVGTVTPRPIGGGGWDYLDMNCATGFTPTGARSVIFHVRFTALPVNEAIRLQVYNSAGPGSATTGEVYLICVKK